MEKKTKRSDNLSGNTATTGKSPLKEAVDGMDKLFEVLNRNVDLISSSK
jgi:hypothetical protein